MTRISEKIQQIGKRVKSTKLPPPLKDIVLTALIGAIVASMLASGSFQKFEYIALDGMFRLRGQRSGNENIAIVNIDDTSLEILGRWPWQRS
jgi:CHASE2 domain-containing sensor protein